MPLIPPVAAQGNPNLGPLDDDSDDISFEDLLAEILAGDPELEFFSFQDDFGSSQNQQDFFAENFDKVFDTFLGELGSAFGGGSDDDDFDLSTLPSFGDFLKEPDFFNQFFNKQTRANRGLLDAPFAAPTRKLFNLGA